MQAVGHSFSTVVDEPVNKNVWPVFPSFCICGYNQLSKLLSALNRANICSCYFSLKNVVGQVCPWYLHYYEWRQFTAKDVGYVQILCYPPGGLKLWAAFPMGLSHLTVPKFMPERHQLLCCVLLAWLWRFLPFWALFSLPWNIGALKRLMDIFFKNYFYFMPISILAACIYGHHIQTRVSDSLGLEYGWLRAKPRKVLCKSNVCSWPLGHLSSPRHSFCSPRWLSQCLRPFSPLLEKSWIDFSWGHQDCLAVC